MQRSVFIASTVSREWVAYSHDVPEGRFKPATFLVLVLIAVRCTSFLPCETFSLEYTGNTPCILTDLQLSHHPQRSWLAQSRSVENLREFLMAKAGSDPQKPFYQVPEGGCSASQRICTLPYLATVCSDRLYLHTHTAHSCSAWTWTGSQKAL